MSKLGPNSTAGALRFTFSLHKPAYLHKDFYNIVTRRFIDKKQFARGKSIFQRIFSKSPQRSSIPAATELAIKIKTRQKLIFGSRDALEMFTHTNNIYLRWWCLDRQFKHDHDADSLIPLPTSNTSVTSFAPEFSGSVDEIKSCPQGLLDAVESLDNIYHEKRIVMMTRIPVAKSEFPDTLRHTDGTRAIFVDTFPTPFLLAIPSYGTKPTITDEMEPALLEDINEAIISHCSELMDHLPSGSSILTRSFFNNFNFEITKQ
eukprot:TRINITY_DN861_c0_g1_i1.p1 TRINITY_DN861_c0_g1~~TRINITY_DN861_c0_g1_i1.p1  ORF type:complete len:261 (+),score=56.06 TRINITY_DN861_c0_g1_i1:68-850(+)